MKLSELKKIVDFEYQQLIDGNYPDYEIVIPIDKPSIGGQAYVQTKGLFGGIDWDSGKLFLKPNVSLTIKSDKEKAYDMAKELLMELATKPGKRAMYREEAQEILKITCNYTNENFEEYRKFFHKVD